MASAEVKFHPTTGMELGFIIEKSGKWANLVFFEEEIILRCTSEGDNTKRKVRIFPITKDGYIKKRLVVLDEQVLLQFGSNIKILPVIVEVVQVLDNALHDWIKSIVPKKIGNVAHNIVFLGFLMRNGILEKTKSFGQPIIDKYLIMERNSIEKQFLLAFC